MTSFNSRATSMLCRICEDEVPIERVENHSPICAIADRCDQNVSSVDERLVRIAETLEKITEMMLARSISSEATQVVVAEVLSEQDDLPQIKELADISRCVANAPLDDVKSVSFLLSCLEDLRVVIDRRKLDAVTVETFGSRIEKLTREKYLQLYELLEDEKLGEASTITDEDAPVEDGVVASLRSPIHSTSIQAYSKDRISIDDFEIIKPIGRGSIDRVYLAKKRTTGDLFAIKVLKKEDVVRKNGVEGILVERDILISVHNPFVVRFFYSFTCRENLYLVMEYLKGENLRSLLIKLRCLDEDVARVYIAEIVHALEYLHSLHVVHRNLKPDNLMIAHDGHLKLTDFGLSKVGPINRLDGLSSPEVSVTTVPGKDEPQLSVSKHSNQQEGRQIRFYVGKAECMAPEILLGKAHDWWSVGVILFELIVGIPPFNMEHPQTISNDMLNCQIQWPPVPGKMSFEAKDLINRLHLYLHLEVYLIQAVSPVAVFGIPQMTVYMQSVKLRISAMVVAQLVVAVPVTVRMNWKMNVKVLLIIAPTHLPCIPLATSRLRIFLNLHQ